MSGSWFGCVRFYGFSGVEELLVPSGKDGLFALLRLSSRAPVRSSRTRTHPLEKGGPPTKHANVEHVTESGGVKKVTNKHIE